MLRMRSFGAFVLLLPLPRPAAPPKFTADPDPKPIIVRSEEVRAKERARARVRSSTRVEECATSCSLSLSLSLVVVVLPREHVRTRASQTCGAAAAPCTTHSYVSSQISSLSLRQGKRRGATFTSSVIHPCTHPSILLWLPSVVGGCSFSHQKLCCSVI